MDDVDRQILSILEEDARNNTNAEISDRVGVSPSTVGKRLRKLEESGVVRGYFPDIDYDRAGLPLHVLFVCTTAIPEREALLEDALAVRGVVSVTELMTGERNVHIEVVGRHTEDITRLAAAIDDLGITINEETLVRTGYQQPASVFEG
jgi:DNA-binding Lrp family transcriptional regulator